jgi:exonuclease VII small subunit
MQKISPTYVRAGIVLLTVLFLVCCVWAAYAGFFLVAGARRVVNAGHTLQDVFANEQGIDALQKSKSAISDLGTGLADLERGMKVLSVARHTPFLGRRYEAFSATLQAAVHIQKALEKTIVVALDVAEVADNAAQISRALGDNTTPYAELSAQERSLVARSFAGSADELQAIAVELELADGNLERASRYISSGVAAGWLRILDERIKQAKEAVAVLLPLSRIAPEALGLAAEKQFLVLFLNETELRGGGGFIGAIFAGLFVQLFSLIGTIIVVAVMSVVGVIMLFNINFSEVIESIKEFMGNHKIISDDEEDDDSYQNQQIQQTMMIKDGERGGKIRIRKNYYYNLF